MFISAIAAFCDKFDPKIIAEYWFKNIDDNHCSDGITMSRILKTILLVANKMPKDLTNRLLGKNEKGFNAVQHIFLKTKFDALLVVFNSLTD